MLLSSTTPNDSYHLWTMATGASSSIKNASKWFCQSRELWKCSASMVWTWSTVWIANFSYPNFLLIRTPPPLRFLELAKGVRIIEVGLYRVLHLQMIHVDSPCYLHLTLTPRTCNTHSNQLMLTHPCSHTRDRLHLPWLTSPSHPSICWQWWMQRYWRMLYYTQWQLPLLAWSYQYLQWKYTYTQSLNVG